MTGFLERPAPAKVNLGLHVLGKRADGFHDVETVMAPLGWSDMLRAGPASSFSFTCSDQSLPTDDSNLVVRAAKLLAETAGAELNIALHLEKRVPFGAGLGSGSSDAAATLLMLSEGWGLQAAPGEIVRMAAELGSDVPFFLQQKTAVATGRGEVIHPLTTSDGEPYRMPFDLVVAVPPVFISTAEAYGLVAPSARGRPDLVSLVLRNDLEEWRTYLVNDFEAVVLAREPEVAHARQVLLESGAGYAALSGSGAAVFGVFERNPDAQRAKAALEDIGCRVWMEPADSSPKSD